MSKPDDIVERTIAERIREDKERRRRQRGPLHRRVLAYVLAAALLAVVTAIALIPLVLFPESGWAGWLCLLIWIAMITWANNASKAFFDRVIHGRPT
jgi:hypothetical protein